MKALLKQGGRGPVGPSQRVATGALRLVARAGIGMLAVVQFTGCATSDPYMTDRGRDAKDVFTFATGGGIGAKARIGPFQTGLLIQSDAAGLRGGGSPAGGGGRHTDVSFVPDTLDLQLLVLGNDSYDPGDPLIRARGKQYDALTVALFSKVKDKCGSCPAYYTEIEAVVALGGSVRFGFNPGELLDFVLGWFGVDLYRDDLEMAASRRGKMGDTGTDLGPQKGERP